MERKFIEILDRDIEELKEIYNKLKETYSIIDDIANESYLYVLITRMESPITVENLVDREKDSEHK